MKDSNTWKSECVTIILEYNRNFFVYICILTKYICIFAA